MASQKAAPKTRKVTEVDKKQLAIAFGVSEPTILARVREGMPVIQRGSKGKAWRFDLAECINWDKERAIKRVTGVIRGDETDANLKRRLLEARVKREEHEAAKAAGEVAPLEEIEFAMTSVFTEVRQAMLAIPERVGLRVLALDDEGDIKELIRDEIDLALNALADADLLGDWDDSDE